MKKIIIIYQIYFWYLNDFYFWFFSIQLEPLFPLFSPQEACQLRNLADSFKTARFYAASDSLAIESHRLAKEVPEQFNFNHRSQLLRISAAVFSLELELSRRQRKDLMRLDEHVTQVFDKLSVAEIMNMSSNELAGKFNCSRRHLNRLFHQQFGFSVASLRMEMRLLKAASLLRDPNAKILNVAEESGFKHLGMFNTFFKRRFGSNPSHWREEAPQSADRFAGPEHIDPCCGLLAKGLCPWSEKQNHTHRLALMQPAA